MVALRTAAVSGAFRFGETVFFGVDAHVFFDEDFVAAQAVQQGVDEDFVAVILFSPHKLKCSLFSVPATLRTCCTT
jgi:hypothetical protein